MVAGQGRQAAFPVSLDLRKSSLFLLNVSMNCHHCPHTSCLHGWHEAILAI